MSAATAAVEPTAGDRATVKTASVKCVWRRSAAVTIGSARIQPCSVVNSMPIVVRHPVVIPGTPGMVVPTKVMVIATAEEVRCTVHKSR